jgi:hypothetical protein
VSCFTLRIIITLMETIKELYISEAPRPLAGLGKSRPSLQVIRAGRLLRLPRARLWAGITAMPVITGTAIAARDDCRTAFFRAR